jgi:DNA repair protein RadA/Sms
MDVFVNVVGGLKITDTGCDLAISLAVASAFYRKPVPKATVAIGEVELLGGVRKASLEDKRIKEAKRLGYGTVIHTLSV